MIRYGGLGIVVLSGLLIGCQTNPPAPRPLPPAMSFDEIRAELTSGNPGAVVGEVKGTYLEYHLVSIGGIDPGQLQLGNAVSFLDSRLNKLGIGSVTKIVPDGNIIVRIETYPGQRDPQIGDVAVHIPLGTMLNTAPAAPVPAPEPRPTTMPAPQPDQPNQTIEPKPPEPASAPAPAPAPAPATAPPATAPAPAAPPATPTPPSLPPMTQPEMNK